MLNAAFRDFTQGDSSWFQGTHKVWVSCLPTDNSGPGDPSSKAQLWVSIPRLDP